VACRRMRGAAVLRALAALTAGCARARAAVPSPDPAGFFIALHEGLFARQGLHEQGQQLADTSRAAAERATKAVPPPPGLTPDIAALISLDSYPAGRAGAVRIHRAAGVMRQSRGAPGSTSRRCYRGIHDGHAPAFPDWAARRRLLGKGSFMGTVWGRSRRVPALLEKGEFHAYDMELRASSSFIRHDSGEEKLCVWPGPESVLAYPARS
jgi:hypothetical protein